MTPWLLGVLVLLDGTFCGFRAAAGRNPRIFLRRYYERALARGAVFAVVTILLFLGAAVGVRAFAGEPGWLDLMRTADRMVLVYGIYATSVLFALSLYLIGSFDLSVLASVLVLGPFTLIRPLVIFGGALYATWGLPNLPSAIIAFSAALVMMRFEHLLALGDPPWKGALPSPAKPRGPED